MEKLFIPYKLAWQLQHERGFDHFNEECIAFWNHYHELHLNNTYKEYAQHLKAPTYEQVLEWFREKHNLQIKVIAFDTESQVKWYYECQDLTLVKSKYSKGKVFKFKVPSPNISNSYYEALHKAIEEAIKLIQNENNNN